MFNRVPKLELASGLAMPDQRLDAVYVDAAAPGIAHQSPPVIPRLILFGLSISVAALVIVLFTLGFVQDGQLSLVEIVLIITMGLLVGWETIPAANAIIGMISRAESKSNSSSPMTVAILVTLRDENVREVMPSKLRLLRSLVSHREHRFEMFVLSDSRLKSSIEAERETVSASAELPIIYRHRAINTAFKSGNIRDWVEQHGAEYDAFVLLDADSEMDSAATLRLVHELSADPACALIQTVPEVMGGTMWQNMQSIASHVYGRLQGRGLAAWMGNEANYYGHNAIVRASAFASCAGLPQLQGHGMWNGTILSHDFVEAALLRRAGWSVKLLATATSSTEHAPRDVIAHLKRDARWCLGNFQHSRILATKGLHPMSRLHLLSGMITYLSSLAWISSLILWAALDVMQAGSGGMYPTFACLTVASVILLPRILGVLHETMHRRSGILKSALSVLTETLFSSMMAPSLMLQRVFIIAATLTNRPISWPSHDHAERSLVDYLVFHVIEIVMGLGLLALVEHGALSFWFLPLAISLSSTPILSWLAGRTQHTKN